MIVASLNIGLLANFLLWANAQEGPTLFLEPFSSANSANRQDFCQRHDELFRNGRDELDLRHALRGKQIRSIITLTSYFNLTEDGTIDEENPGIVADLLDELATRGGFTWRDSFGVVKGPGKNRTWTDLLGWATEEFDVAADWWMKTTERMSMGIAFSEGWYDASTILVGLAGEKEIVSLWSWLSPFDATVWICIMFTILGSAVVLASLDRLDPTHPKRSKQKKTKANRKLDKLFKSAITFTGHLQHHPGTDPTRIFTFSLALFSLLMMSAHTANLANFLVTRNSKGIKIRSVGDAVKANMPICVYKATATEEILQRAFPSVKFRGYETEHENFLALRRGECKFVATSVSSFDNFQDDRSVNPDCKLEWVGRIFHHMLGGFATKADSGIKCTNLVRDVINLHMIEMKADGFVDRAWRRHLDKVASVKCTEGAEVAADDPSSEVQLNMDHLGGLFLMHAMFTVVAILWAIAYRIRHDYFSSSADEGKDKYLLRRGSHWSQLYHKFWHAMWPAERRNSVQCSVDGQGKQFVDASPSAFFHEGKAGNGHLSSPSPARSTSSGGSRASSAEEIFRRWKTATAAAEEDMSRLLEQIGAEEKNDVVKHGDGKRCASHLKSTWSMGISGTFSSLRSISEEEVPCPSSVVPVGGAKSTCTSLETTGTESTLSSSDADLADIMGMSQRQFKDSTF